MTVKQTAFLVAFCVAAIPVGIGMYRARRWIWRYFHDAPLMLRISAGVALFALVVSLLAGSQRATEAITWIMVASIVVAALWGRWRYGNAPRLQRWDATWASVERALPGILRKLIGSSLKDSEKMIASATHSASEQPPTGAPPERF